MTFLLCVRGRLQLRAFVGDFGWEWEFLSFGMPQFEVPIIDKDPIYGMLRTVRFGFGVLGF